MISMVRHYSTRLIHKNQDGDKTITVCLGKETVGNFAFVFKIFICCHFK